jgi:hypothetical protein
LAKVRLGSQFSECRAGGVKRQTTESSHDLRNTELPFPARPHPRLEAPSRSAVGCRDSVAVQRSPDRARRGVLLPRPAKCRSRGSSPNAPMLVMRPAIRGLWVKLKCENREDFVVVGWTDPVGSRPCLRGAIACVLRSERAPRLRRARRGWN